MSAVYRMFDLSGHLLYVGASGQPLARVAEHGHKDWWRDVVRVDIAHYPTLREALAAEGSAIETEAPRYNRVRPVRLATAATVTLASLRRGRALREARERANLSQEELAHELNVSAKTVGQWERGRAVPRPRHRRLLEDTLGMAA